MTFCFEFMIAEDATAPEEDEHNVAKNKNARKVHVQSRTAQETSKQAQPDLMPRMTSRERHGNQILRDSMKEMATMSQASEHAADRRFEATQQMQYECMLFKQKQMMYAMQCTQQAQRNASINTHNAQLLEIWHKIGGTAPNLLLLDVEPVAAPPPPVNPATRRAVEQAALKEAEAAQQAQTHSNTTATSAASCRSS